jgi:hypothetical protein
MSRADFSLVAANGAADPSADALRGRAERSTAGCENGVSDNGVSESAGSDSAKIAEDIGIAALELAKRARDAGLPTIGYLLESAALEAGAEAAAGQLQADVAGK